MPKRDDNKEVSETGNWNVASDYARSMIMEEIYLAKEYSRIARFGTTTLQEELEGIYGNKQEMQLKGFERLLDCLITLIDNSLFAIKNKNDKKKLNGYRITLKKIEKIIPKLYAQIINNIKKTRELNINYKVYHPVLETVLKIKSRINEPLNKAHLIFTDKEEFDPKEFKKRMKERMVNKG